MARKYLYGIIPGNGESSFGPGGLGASDMYAVVHRGLACLVADYQGEKLQARFKEDVVRSVLLHQAAVETVMRNHTVLPIMPGTVVSDEADVRRFLQQGYLQFVAALDQIHRARAEGDAEGAVGQDHRRHVQGQQVLILKGWHQRLHIGGEEGGGDGHHG